MTTERMTDEAFTFLSQQGYFDRQDIRRVFAEAKRARRVEQEQAEKIKAWEVECHNLRDMLRLANDKMAEQVRQARREVADVALLLQPNGRERYLEGVRDANAPKD